MAHNLNYNEKAKQYAMFVADKPAWHNLGVLVKNALNWEDAMKQALLNWEVEKVQFNNPITGKPIDHYGIFRKDTSDFLGGVGDGYLPIQNRYVS